MCVILPTRLFQVEKNWWEGLKGRRNLSIRKPERLGSVRARMLNPQVVGKYFTDLQELIDRLGLADKPKAYGTVMSRVKT